MSVKQKTRRRKEGKRKTNLRSNNLYICSKKEKRKWKGSCLITCSSGVLHYLFYPWALNRSFCLSWEKMATGFCSINTCLVLNRRSDSIFRHFPSSYPTSWSTQKRSSIRYLSWICLVSSHGGSVTNVLTQFHSFFCHFLFLRSAYLSYSF